MVADYVAFGSFFKTKTKDDTSKVFFSSIHSWNKFKKIPSVGIGGINYRNLSSIRELNLDYIALSSFIWNNKIKSINIFKENQKLN